MGKYREIYERYREIWQKTVNLEEIKGDLEDTHRIWKRSSVKTTEKFVEDTRRSGGDT
jgi:tryptophan 2,3-dioxygenase